MTREELGNKINELRKQRGLSIRELAEKSELNKATIVNLEKGRFSPKVETLENVLKALGAKIEIKGTCN